MRSMLKLWLLLGLLFMLAPAEAAGGATKGLRYASLTPDGKSVVFCYRGDIWISTLDGKDIDRLTIHEAQDTLARVSPDGKQIAFSSRRHGNYDVYVMPITGGVPKRVTYHSGFEAVCDWSPDGKKLLFVSERAGDKGRTDLYEQRLEGGTPRRITRDGARDGAYSPDGKSIVYARGFLTIYWDNYRGSANYDLYTVPAAGGIPRRLTHTPGNERYPFFSKDGTEIYFTAEEKGVANFYGMPAAGGERRQITKYKGADVHRPDLAWDHKTAVFERAGQLYTVDLSDPKAKTVSIPISIQSDVRNSGIETRTITSGGEQVHISYDGTQAAFALRGDVWLMPAAGGKGRRVTSGKAKDEWPRFSPDGKTMAFQSNRTGNTDIFLMDIKSSRIRQLTRHRANDFFFNWSPDSKSLVFCSERSGNRDIWLIDVESGMSTQLTNDRAGDDDPSFSPDGNLIAFDSNRGGSQAIYVMNKDGSNVRRITQGAGFLQVPSFSPDGQMLVFEAFIPQGGRSGGLFIVSASGGQSMLISRDGQTACWRGDYIYFTARRRGGAGVFRVKAPTSVEAGERLPFIGTVEVDLRRELGQLFDEAWTALKDGFYDAKMHKVDWKKMRTKYRDMAIDAENKDEFQNVVRQMLAELGASHLGISGGHRSGNAVTPKITLTGYLGVDFEQAPESDGSRKVAAVLRAGPADRAGIRVGDVVTKIGRTALRTKTNLDKVMTGTVGKTIPVSFKPRSAEGLGLARTTPIQPIDFGALRKLRYSAWTAQSDRRVKEATKGGGGQVAYLHLSSMNPQNLAKFQQSVARWNRSKRIKGMVLDVRENGGGNIHNQLMAVLWAKPLARVRIRNRPEAMQPGLYWDRPIVLLINERSFSDAEVFPYMFQKAGIGKVIGVPTPGGVIGTNNITLSDGSSFRIPRTGFKGMDGTNLEGYGVKPDFVVEETAEDRLAGRDPQLEKAIEVIKEEIAARKKVEKARKKTKPAAKKPEAATPEKKPVKPVAAEVDPLLDARAGEWVRYRLRAPDATEDTIFRVSITQVKEGKISILKEVEKGGGALPPLPDQAPVTNLIDALKNFGQVETHVIVDGKVKDKATRVLLADIKWPDGSKLKMVFANEVPVYGLLRVEMNKLVMLEAIDWSEPIKTDPVKEADEPKKEAVKAVPSNPLFDAKEGEWVKFRTFGHGGQEIEMITTVDEVSDDEVVLKQSILIQGRKIRARTMRRARTKELVPPGDREATGYGTAEITIGGKTFRCITMTAGDGNGGELKWYVSPDIPVDGYVRVERNGKVIEEIVEWGNG